MASPSSDVSPEVLERIARTATRLSAELDDLARRLSSLGEQAVETIGGTATGEDRRMLALARQALDHTRVAAGSFADAAVEARRAAAQARRDAEDAGRSDPRHQGRRR